MELEQVAGTLERRQAAGAQESVGTDTRASAYSRLRYPQRVLPWAIERILQTAPSGADLRSWRY